MWGIWSLKASHFCVIKKKYNILLLCAVTLYAGKKTILLSHSLKYDPRRHLTFENPEVAERTFSVICKYINSVAARQ